MPPLRRNGKKRRREKVRDANTDEASPEGQQQLPGHESDWWQDISQKLSLSELWLGKPGRIQVWAGSSLIGQFHIDDEEEKFKYFLRVSRKTFDYICSLVKPDMSARPAAGYFNVDGRILTVEKQVAIALRRLASGESQLNVGESFDVGQSIVSQVTWKFVESMEERGMHHLKWPDDNEMKEIKTQFEMLEGLPNCCGAIDATHIIMSLPSAEASSVWHDSEENYSMILQAIVDSRMRFRDILTGWPGSMTDYCLLKSSGFYKLCECAQRLNGPVKELEGAVQIREYIVGDGGYPLLPWLLTPFQGKDLSPSKQEFNAKHYGTRLIAERALARFKGTWRIIDGVMWRPDKHKLPRIILVCCMLHNIIIDLGDELRDDVPLTHHHDSGYKQQLCQYSNETALNTRELLSSNFSHRKNA